MSIFSSTETVIKTIHPSWLEILKPEINNSYFKKLMQFLANEAKSNVIYPPEKQIFSWTHLTELNTVKIVILGQDPYHGKGQAHGLAFSVLEPCKPPGSLVNIYSELKTDIEGFKIPEHGNLTNWAKQGVLMLNSVLTVKAGAANSHKEKGWETLTDAVIKSLNKRENLVFILWGEYAKKKCESLDLEKHMVIQCAHPSPLSAKAGFFGSKCFSKANEYLKSKDIKEIDWNDL